MGDVKETGLFMIDEAYEFSAPRFFDFVNGETEEDMHKAELWFETDRSYAPSPFMTKIKTARTDQIQSLCDFSDAGQTQKELLESTATSDIAKASYFEPEKQISSQIALMPSITKEELATSVLKEEINTSLYGQVSNEKTSVLEGEEVCTPAPTAPRKADILTNSKKHQDAKKIASMLKNPSSLKTKGKLQEPHGKLKPASEKRRLGT